MVEQVSSKEELNKIAFGSKLFIAMLSVIFLMKYLYIIIVLTNL
jgi:hypothetical protein